MLHPFDWKLAFSRLNDDCDDRRFDSLLLHFFPVRFIYLNLDPVTFYADAKMTLAITAWGYGGMCNPVR